MLANTLPTELSPRGHLAYVAEVLWKSDDAFLLPWQLHLCDAPTPFEHSLAQKPAFSDGSSPHAASMPQDTRHKAVAGDQLY